NSFGIGCLSREVNVNRPSAALAVGLLLFGIAAPVSTQSGAGVAARDLLKDPSVAAALEWAKSHEAETIADQIRFAEIPAPSFHEEVKGRELQKVFQQIGLQ